MREWTTVGMLLALIWAGATAARADSKQRRRIVAAKMSARDIAVFERTALWNRLHPAGRTHTSQIRRPKRAKSDCVVHNGYTIYGLPSIAEELRGKSYFCKALIGHTATVFFPGEKEHNSVRIGDLYYRSGEDGSAMATTIKPAEIAIRRQAAFSDTAVAFIIKRLLTHPKMTFMRSFAVTYHGDPLLRIQ